MISIFGSGFLGIFQTMIKPPYLTTHTELFALFLFCAMYLTEGMGGYWRFDDGAHLDFVFQHSPLQYFFDPEIAKAQAGVFITPWNALFYDINLAFFRLDVKYHYLHLLVVIFATALVIRRIASFFMDSVSSFAVSLFFLAGIPTFRVSNELMTGHYAYGLLFACASLYLFVKYFRAGMSWYLLGSAICYLLAVSCKEVFIPLPMILFLRSDFR